MNAAAGQYSTAEAAMHLAEAAVALPGPAYYEVLVWIHRALRPTTYVEIGIGRGDSLRTALPGTVCCGIDPFPDLRRALSANTAIEPMTSDEFFLHRDLRAELGCDHFSVAFIDGLHLFEQALRDFIHIEQFAGPNSLVVLHDCLPLNEVTSARTRTTEFYSGDTWKLTLCLRHARPDLRMAIVPAFPTGLCLVGNLNADSTVLAGAYDTYVARYVDLTFDDHDRRAAELPARIANTRASVTEWVQFGTPLGR